MIDIAAAVTYRLGMNTCQASWIQSLMIVSMPFGIGADAQHAWPFRIRRLKAEPSPASEAAAEVAPGVPAAALAAEGNSNGTAQRVVDELGRLMEAGDSERGMARSMPAQPAQAPKRQSKVDGNPSAAAANEGANRTQERELYMQHLRPLSACQ